MVFMFSMFNILSNYSKALESTNSYEYLLSNYLRNHVHVVAISAAPMMEDIVLDEKSNEGEDTTHKAIKNILDTHETITNIDEDRSRGEPGKNSVTNTDSHDLESPSAPLLYKRRRSKPIGRERPIAKLRKVTPYNYRDSESSKKSTQKTTRYQKY